MDYRLDDTIVAIASPPGGGVRGIVRLSGPQAINCVESLVEESTLQGRAHAHTVSVELRLPAIHSRLPGMLYLWPNERSFTHQPAAEFHTFGSLPLLHAVVSALCANGARLARPGEFTLRAFLAGRMDLTQAEAVLSVIEADDKVELRAALDLAAGGIGGQVNQLREALLDLLARLEAGLDFVEEDIEFISAAEVDGILDTAIASIANTLEQVSSRQQTDDRLRVVLVGLPNAGKSSLLNALADRDVALVSNQAGTTRDYLEVDVELNGIRLRLIDTAGLVSADAGDQNNSSHVINAAAQRQSAFAMARADIILQCDEQADALRDAFDESHREATAGQGTATVIRVVTKVDRQDASDSPTSPGEGLVQTSAISGAGLQELQARLVMTARNLARRETRMLTASIQRCDTTLRLALGSLTTAKDNVRPVLREELIASGVRVALEQLGEVTGAFYTDDLLDRIFSRFCIGK